MKVVVERHGKVTVLVPQGDMKIGDGDVALRAAMNEQIAQGHLLFVLNLSNVRFMDSAGIGETVASLKRVQEQGGEFKICGLTPRVAESFTTTQLIRVVAVFPDEKQAIASFV